MRACIALLLAVVTLGGVSACSDDEPEEDRKVAFASPALDGAQPKAVTYNVDLVPASGRIGVVADSTDDGTRIELAVQGLVPGRGYGAHVHVKPCGANPADSGSHYQNVKDPVTPSVDPQYANSANEVWLDFTTDASGNAKANTTVQWRFREGEANSLVVHAQRTATHAGHAGTAGDRLACVTERF